MKKKKNDKFRKKNAKKYDKKKKIETDELR